MLVRHRRCGQQFTPAVSCAACGQPLHPGEVEVLRGPGARTGPGTAILSQVIGGRARQPEPGSTVIGVRGVQRPRGSTPEDGFDNLR